MNRPLGALHNPFAVPRGVPIMHLAAVRSAVTDLPDVVDRRALVARIVNQTDSGCVSHALGQCLRVRAAFEGRTMDPSERAIYAGARELEHPSAASLPDVGSYPELAIDWTEEFGIAARERMPDETPVGQRVGDDCLESSAIALVVGSYNITTTGSARQTEIKAALASGNPALFAMDVDQSYEDYTTGVWNGMTGSAKGGHAQAIVGYTAAGIIVANSWGTAWGMGGFSIISWDYATSSALRDFYVVTSTPTEPLQ